jgi:hypothetical protein
MKHIEIDGKRYLWRDVLQLRREQKKAFARSSQACRDALSPYCPN